MQTNSLRRNYLRYLKLYLFVRIKRKLNRSLANFDSLVSQINWILATLYSLYLYTGKLYIFLSRVIVTNKFVFEGVSSKFISRRNFFLICYSPIWKYIINMLLSLREERLLGTRLYTPISILKFVEIHMLTKLYFPTKSFKWQMLGMPVSVYSSAERSTTERPW